MTEVYTIKVTYKGCKNKIWRELQISSNAFLCQLGYAILATFDTKAYHLFNIMYNEVSYELPNEDEAIEEEECLFCIKLSELGLQKGSKLQMIYDFGCEQIFDMVVTNIEPMAKSTGRAYPKIIAGEGRGIIDDMSAHELLEVINDIDKNGSSTFTIEDDFGREYLWDYRNYNIKFDNALLKGKIDLIADGYSAFEAYLDL